MSSKNNVQGLYGVTSEIALKAFLGFMLFAIGLVFVFIGVVMWINKSDAVATGAVTLAGLIVSGMGMIRFYREYFKWKRK